MKTKPIYSILINSFFIIASICFIVPFIIIIAISISNENDVVSWGYSIIPKHIDFAAYKMVLADMTQMGKAFFVTIYSAIIGSLLTVLINASIGYAISQPQFTYRKPITWYIVFTMLFGGGLIPSYIINTQYLGLGDNLLIYIVTGLVAGWYIILFRTFFNQIPASLIESAVIDGASQFRVLSSIIIPMSKPIVASVFFMTAIGRWNDWQTSLYYISNKDLYTIQYFMQKTLRDAEFLRKTYLDNPMFSPDTVIPVETLKFAMCVIATIPIFIFFPFIQKYFSKGISIGAVKE